MIHSLFLFYDKGEIIFEKHWRKPTDLQMVIDKILNSEKVAEPLLKINTNPTSFAAYTIRNGIFIVSVTNQDVPPSILIEFLDRFHKILVSYLHNFNVDSISANTVIIYELLSEMIDDGSILMTNFHVLRDLIRPTSIVNRVTDLVTNATNILTDVTAEQLTSDRPWRKDGIVHSKNEMYFDIVEVIDAILSKDLRPIFTNINGSIIANLRLSGTPSVSVTCTNMRNLPYVSVHPCVKLKRLEKDRLLSFIPPNGKFELLNYMCQANTVNQSAIPVNVKYLIHSNEFEVSISSKLKKPVSTALITLC
ncbi:hypothetical protein GJ496_003447 [Pomphorhynchus laevis]|nr:hypothetical protein GJ496_003447 [Pomphorhynchus laevis]